MEAPFETRERGDDGDTFVTLRDDAPDWLVDAVREAHGDEMPNDWRYEISARIFDALTDDPTADRHELADGLVDIYTGARLAWLAADIGRAGLVDEACDELGIDLGGIVDQVGAGQYVVISQMVDIIADAIDENAGES